MTIYQNPIFRGDYPDPTVICVGNEYYATHSSFNYSPGLLIWRSQNLVDWHPVCHALTEYDGDVWAPDLVYHGGRFFIYYRTTGGNHVVHAPSIEGPWSKPAEVCPHYIDPGHVVGADGRRFLHISSGMMVDLDAEGLKALGEPRKVFDAWPIPKAWAIEGECLEGPKLFWKDGTLHLLQAEGGTAGPATSHMVVSARGPGPEGPWEYSPYNPPIHTRSPEEKWWSRGHGSLIETPDGRWYCMSHAYQKGFLTLGRQTVLEPVEWTPDGWWKLPEGHDCAGNLPTPAGRKSAPSSADSWEDRFDGAELGWRWRFWGAIDRNRYTAGPDGLVLTCQGNTLADSPPMTCIPQHESYTAEVDFTLEGDGAQAGLIVFYNDQCAAGVLAGEGRLTTVLYGKILRGIPIPFRSGRLRLVNDRHEVSVYARAAEGGDWIKNPMSFETSGLHHNAFGGFLSLRVGLLAVGTGAVRYRNFSYSGQRELSR